MISSYQTMAVETGNNVAISMVRTGAKNRGPLTSAAPYGKSTVVALWCGSYKGGSREASLNQLNSEAHKFIRQCVEKSGLIVSLHRNRKDCELRWIIMPISRMSYQCSGERRH